MKHRRGVSLTGKLDRDGITYLGPLQDSVHTTFGDIPQWKVLGAHCSKCEHETWLIRFDLAKKWGEGTYLNSLTSRLRCRACGNKDGNKWILGQLPR